MNQKIKHDAAEAAAPAGAPDAAGNPAPEAGEATPPPPPSVPPPPATAAAPDAEAAAWKDKYLRLMADFDNFRKRQAREREEYTRRATESLMEDLLPVLDHLQLALASDPDKTTPLASGVQMVADQLLATLGRFDLKPFTALGEPFDPTRHEAVSEIAHAQVPAQHVLHQLRGGYLLGNRLLRPARVVVSSGPAKPAAAEPPPATPVCEETSETPNPTP
jgi:molecular chaperone GrpE